MEFKYNIRKTITLDAKDSSLKYKKNRGFTLIELLIVVAVVAIISVSGIAFYFNYGKGVEIKSVSNTLSFDLKQAQSRSMIGEGGFKWGIHFVNGTSDYYEIFSTLTDYSAATVASRVYLPGSVVFSDPASSSTKDIIFNKISGGTTLSSVVITSLNLTRTITVSSLGGISVQ